MFEKEKESDNGIRTVKHSKFSYLLVVLIVIVVLILAFLLTYYLLYFYLYDVGSIKQQTNSLDDNSSLSSSIEKGICSDKNKSCEISLSNQNIVDTCKNIQEDLKDQCFIYAAEKYFRQDYCDSITDSQLKQECNKFFYNFQMEDPYKP